MSTKNFATELSYRDMVSLSENLANISLPALCRRFPAFAAVAQGEFSRLWIDFLPDALLCMAMYDRGDLFDASLFLQATTEIEQYRKNSSARLFSCCLTATHICYPEGIRHNMTSEELCDKIFALSGLNTEAQPDDPEWHQDDQSRYMWSGNFASWFMGQVVDGMGLKPEDIPFMGTATCCLLVQATINHAFLPLAEIKDQDAIWDAILAALAATDKVKFSQIADLVKQNYDRQLVVYERGLEIYNAPG